MTRKMTSEMELFLPENVLFDEKCLSFPAQACANYVILNQHTQVLARK